MKAVEVIMEHGVPEERIIFINLVSGPFQYNAECSDCRHCHDYPCRSLLLKDSRTSAPSSLRYGWYVHGLTTLYSSMSLTAHPAWQITGWIDQGLNEKAYIIPGLGDFGERR